MVYLVEINQSPSPYSMLQYIGRVTTPKLVPRNCLWYLQTTLIMGKGGLVSELMWGIVDSQFQLQQFCFLEQISKKSILLVENTKNDYHYWSLHIQISQNTNFRLKLTIVIFWTKAPKKCSYFQSKTDKIDTVIEFCIFEFSLCTKFYFEQTILNFWTKFAQERYLWSKTEKMNIIIKFCLFKLVLVPNFTLNWQFYFLWPDLPKKGFSGQNKKKWRPHTFYIIL